ncbi:MAG: cryptochrome/photolyase family protein [Parachlamydiales bacterium]|nr:cryptochrome/photolyase family protein [Parachlamydiales bacterium]
MKTTIILPNQLFPEHPSIKITEQVIIVEDPLFFVDRVYPVKFHQQKLSFLRSAMKQYEALLKKNKISVHYVETKDILVKGYEKIFKKFDVTSLHVVDVVDFIAEKRLNEVAKNLSLAIEWHDTPSFLTPQNWFQERFKNLKHFSFTPFYIAQRKRLDVLIDADGKPTGGQWSFDVENRKKVPKSLKFPKIPSHPVNAYDEEAVDYVKKRFKDHPGDAQGVWVPTNHSDAKKWFNSFLKDRLKLFGDYEDAIVKEEDVLFHSVLSPLLNSGLLTPEYVLKKTLEHHEKQPIPLNSLEGFIRQVIGWREFVRAIYVHCGVKQRNSNFFKHTRQLPKAFYDGTTGIPPIDDTIQKVLKNSYCHHIERLMILGNFFLLCEIDPEEVYKWFMELFIDAYDWVMVPNVYGMSQYADGGLMVTKPYFSGSNYLCKMGYKKGDWCVTWDALFWRFLDKHKEFFKKQPRWKLLLGYLKKKGPEYIEEQKKHAEKFLRKLR